MECGCEVVKAFTKPTGNPYLTVQHCPMHAAAGDMLAALGTAKVALLNRDKARGLPDERSLWEALAATTLDQVEAAIAAARGGPA